MSEAEQINLAEMIYSKLSRESLVQWRSLPKYKDGHPDANYILATESDLKRFLITNASTWSEESGRRYQPDKIELGQILFAIADQELNITASHSEPIAVLMGGGGRDTYIYKTDNPNIFCNVRVLEPKLREERHVTLQASSQIYLEKYTPEQRAIMLDDLNSPRTREWRLK